MNGLLRRVLIAQRAQADVFAELTADAIQLATGDEESQHTIAVDLDGTLAHHRHPFSHTSIGDPIDGAREAVEHLKKLAPRVVILTARPHLAAVREWVQRHNIPVDDVTNVKDHTMRLIIDDRGCHFNGDWPSTLKRAESRLKSHDAEELSTFQEDQHPRGQPENKGEFAPKGGSVSQPVGAPHEYKELGTKAPAFKAWFGDWEKSPAEASKVVNKDGEPAETYHLSKVRDNDGKPVVVYHGSATKGIKEFDLSKVDPGCYFGPGFYFTEGRNIALGYTGDDEAVDAPAELVSDPPMTDDLRSEILQQVKQSDAGGKVFARAEKRAAKGNSSFTKWLRSIPGRTRENTPETMHKMLGQVFMEGLREDWEDEDIKKSIIDKLGMKFSMKHPEPKQGALYASYLNIRNPYPVGKEIPAEKIPDKWREFLRQAGVPDQPSYKWRDMDRNHEQQGGHIRSELVQMLKDMGYDGVRYSDTDNETGDQHRNWVAFHPTQIKSVDNAGTFNPASSRIDLATATAEPAEWVSYQGRRGGKGWRSAQTGRIVYQIDMPGGHQHVGAQQQELVPAEGKSEHAAYHAIKEGDLGYVQGFPVRRTGKDRWRLLEIAKGHVEGAPEDVQAHINEIKRHEANAKPMIDRALERAKSHTEPDFFREPDRVEKEAKAFDSLPHGAHVVSLEPHTRGRLGQIVRRVEDGRSVNRVKLHGIEGWAGNHVEPLDVHHSWRMPHEDKPKSDEPPAPKMRQGFLFSTDGENWQPVYLDIPIVGGILKRGWDKIKSGYERLMEKLRHEPEMPEEDLPEDGEVEGYMHGEWLPVTSSNVEAIRYLPDDSALEVEYHGSNDHGPAFYRYEDIPPGMALSFARARSPGGWVWDNLRVRGTVYSYQKPYSFISGPSTYQPKWMADAASRLRHGRLMSTEDMTGEEFAIALECWSAEEQQASDRWMEYVGPHGVIGRLQLATGIIEYPIELATAHAPKGGITIAGKQFTGGEFIPPAYQAQATPEQKAQLHMKGGWMDSIKKFGHQVAEDMGLAKPKMPERPAPQPIDKMTPANARQEWSENIGRVPANLLHAQVYPPDKQLPQDFYAWESNATEDERKALLKYTTGEVYTAVNGALRGDGEMDPKTAETYKHLAEAFRKAPPLQKPITVWRGMELKPDEHEAVMTKFKDAIHSGEPMSLQGFTSATLSPPIASAFSQAGGRMAKINDDANSKTGAFTQDKTKRGMPVVMEIRTRHGIYLDGHSTNPIQREFVLNHASKFKVTGMRKTHIDNYNGRGSQEYTVVQMEHTDE